MEGKGKLFEELLVHRAILQIRRTGLMFALDFDSAERVQHVVTHALREGVICFRFLSHPNSFRIAPPLTISETEIREACAVILKAIENS